MGRNLTIQLDEETIRDAKALAARKGTSVSGYVARKIHEEVAASKRYEHAKQRALRAMDEARDHGGFVEPWTREQLYDRHGQ